MVALSAILTQISWFKGFNELFVIEHRESLWNPLLNFLTRKLRKGILSFITTLKHKNDTLFGRKQHVVWEKTIRCLRENDTLFERKRHVVYEKTTRCLRENDTLFGRKRHVVYEKKTRRLKWKEESEKERKILRRWFRMRRRVKVGILKIHHFHRKCDSNKC